MRNQIKTLAALGLVVVAIVGLAAFFYSRSAPDQRRATNATSNSNASISAERLVRSDSPTLGPANAKVTLVEFYDPECEACAAFHPIVKKLLNDYKGKVRLVVRYMPLHPNSVPAASFTEAAGEQGKYWQAQELLFQKQSEWGEKHGQPAGSSPETSAVFKQYAADLDLDWNKIDQAMKENRYTPKIDRDKREGQALGVRQTPTFFANGTKLLDFSENALRQLVEAELQR